MLINPLLLIVIIVIAVLVGWFARKQMVKVRPDEVSRLDRQGNMAVDSTSDAINAARQRANDALKRD